MNNFESYLDSDDFRLFLDQSLRQHACTTVDKLCKNNLAKDFIDRSQLYSIPVVIQAAGLKGFMKLIDQQSKKNTKSKNKAFWSFLSSHMQVTSQSTEAFSYCIRNEITSFLEDQNTAGESKQQQNIIKKQNKNKINQAIDRALDIYFEHFICHYSFCAAQRKREEALKGAR